MKQPGYPSSHPLQQDDSIPPVEAGEHVQEGAIGGEVGSGGGDRPLLVVTRACEYKWGGVCVIHGRGATRKWRGGHKMTIGRRGLPVKRYQREYYYECEGNKMIQTRLAFSSSAIQPGSEAREDFQNFTSTEGQNDNCADQDGKL